MARPRWRKLARDLAAERGRLIAMIVAVSVSLAAIGSVAGAAAILTREIAVNYLGTRPASATLELPGGIDPRLLQQVRARPEIAEAEARDVVLSRVRVGDDWRPLLLFVVDDFSTLRLNTFRPQTGAWPPPEGTVLIERAAVTMLEAGPGQQLVIRTPSGLTERVPITGTVHDPGLAPAWQERMGYAYLTRATLARLGESDVLHELRIAVRDHSTDRAAIVATATALARDLGERGHPVEEIHVPAPARHPHQLQMVTILTMLLVFAVMALVLSAILVATSLAAMLARQVREIGIMKTVGARTSQLAALYLVFVAMLGLSAFLLAWPLGVVGARGLAGAIAQLLNFDLTSSAIPPWVIAAQAAAGLVVPLVVAAIPILRACRATVRDAIDRYGVSTDTLRMAFVGLPRPLRDASRRPGRLALTLVLLAAGGAMFMTALNLRASWMANLDKFYAARHYDLELRLRDAESLALVDEVRRIPGVRDVEAWGYTPTTLSRAGEPALSTAYPDGSHASFTILAPPAATEMVRFPLLAGRWLVSGDREGVVLNHSARAQLPNARLGEMISLTVDGRPTRWRLVGVVEEIGSPATAYVTDDAFGRVSGTTGKARMLRISTFAVTDARRTQILHAVEAALDGDGVRVERGLPIAEHRTAVGDHIIILIRALVAMAIVMAVVGALGLASTMSTSIVERTRELGVMKTLGATRRRIVGDLLAEALSIGGLSSVFALALALPLTVYVDRLIGRLGFLASLPFVIVPGALVAWVAMVAVVSVVATVLPARRAAAISVREGLAHG